MKRNFNVRFDELSKEANSIIDKKYNKYSEMLNQNLTLVDETRLAVWEQRVKNLLADVYGKDSDFYKDFINAKNNNFLSTNYEVLLKKQKPIFDSALTDMHYIHESKGSVMNSNNIFIGHGRSHLWRELKDFIKDKLQLSYDEFNRVPVAGTTNIARLQQMLEQASFAFLIMTAEDELNDGKMQARMNVIHEVGLFQGRLGFEKAIILLEEGCEEFSNINGLGQIRFPKGNISAISEKIREVLERENIIRSQ
ncbi:TIR domain-containing protein [Moellerella wisconsensis]|uniref:TIR domain-containing protein n=1 Tax=Moellerella wisconsensis TaxID=158849 RepID=UPI001F4E3291|nr:TIR domain-containing protein [Moellerella wisconsensis]UNH22797.1 nucleotide-binding protein [Moellerella wisconsensis]UNH22811.1 nucleotide-binding protein [Moellerella wisconsensis]UNH22825.1 nucleotide-binding protein [Moellerella wisconsensis]